MIRFFTLSALLFTSFFVSHAQDITVSMTGKTTFAPNEEFVNDINVKNEGIVATASFYTGVYISVDDKWQVSDKEVGIFGPVSLAAGASQVLSARTYASTSVAPGNYFLIIKADRYDAVVETDETNNEWITAITVTSPQIDFVFDSFSLSKTSFTQNEKIMFTYSTSNASTVNAGGRLSVGLYISSDAIWSNDDKLLNYDYKNLTALDQITRSISDNSSFFISNSPPGNYFIIARIDYYDEYYESNKTNNTSSIAITVQPSDVDLRILSFYQWSSMDSFSPLQLLVTVINNGTTPAGPLNIDAISVNDNSQISPVFIAEEYIMPGETKNIIFTYNYYNGYGIFPIKLTINTGRSINETNYSNNSYTGTITILPPPEEKLTLRGLSYTSIYDNTDKDITLNLSLENTGFAYYSDDMYTIEITNSANILVYTQDFHPSIYGGRGTTESIAVNLNLSSPLPPGQYQTLIKCSTAGYNCVTTFDVSTITLNIQQIQYTLTGTIKGEDGTPITKGNLFLYQKTDDGTVKFIQKITPTTSSSFSFPVDEHKHTLYFIPDRQAYPDYVPTVYGKTLTLENESLFQLSQNTSVQFEILKIQPLAQGEGVISGTVTNEEGATAGRVSSLSAGTPVANAPVILLSSTGVINGLTYTNENGYYEFRNLPRASYQLLVSRELNVAGMEEPYPVSITSKNASINFTTGTSEVTVQEEVLLFDQTINFTAIPSLRYGSSPISLSAQSSSGLPVNFSVSDPALAEIKNGQLIITGVGSLTINALQQGNSFYKEVNTAQTLTIGKGEQQINFAPLVAKTFGDASFNINAKSSTALPVVITSSDLSVASVKENIITIVGAGKVTLSASQAGNNLYEATSTSQELIINKASQFISFVVIPEQQFTLGEMPLNINVSSGLKATLTSSNTTIAIIENEKAIAIKPGQVTITASQAGDKNYLPAEPQSFTFIINEVTGIEEASPMITLYPNPSSAALFIDHAGPIENLEIIDPLGRSFTGWTLSSNSINIESLSAGAYLLKFNSLNKSYSMRFIKK